MHPSALRLLDCARRSTATAPAAERVSNFTSLLKRMDISSGTMTNWKKRGVSKEGAITAEELFGCRANWILDGTTPDWTEPHSAGTGVATRTVAQELSLAGYKVAPGHVDWERLMLDPLAAEFQTTAPDSAMAPIVHRGDRVILITGVDPRPGDFVLVADRQGTPYLREYRRVTLERWEAHALHPSFLPMDSERDGLKVLAVYDGVRGRRAVA